MNNASLETLKVAYAKAQELGRTHVRFNESGKAAYFQVSTKNGAYSLQEIQDRIIDLECPLGAVVFEDDEMPTREEFFGLGFGFVKGDVLFNCDTNENDILSSDNVSYYLNKGGCQSHNYKIKSLVPRKNMGVQPCGGECLVTSYVKGFINNLFPTRKAMDWSWSLGDAYPIAHWIPSKENFIKPQPAKLPETQVMEQGFKIESLQNDIKRLEALLADEKANHERTKSALTHKQDILDILQSTINLFQYK